MKASSTATSIRSTAAACFPSVRQGLPKPHKNFRLRAVWAPVFVLVLAMTSFSACAQYAINWWSIDGGGGVSTGGVYRVQGAIGQADSAAMIGGTYVLQGGFWAGGSLPVVSNPPTLSVVRVSPDQIRISWAPEAAGFVLQETTSLSAAGWTQSPSGNTNPVVVSTGRKAVFYRLVKP